MNTISTYLAFPIGVSMLCVSCSRTPPASAVEATYDGQSGRLSQLTIDKATDGKPNVFSYMDGTRFLRIETDMDEDGKIDRWEYYSADQKLEKVGFSRSNDGIADAWAFQAPDGTIARVEVSTRRDGRPNRVEFYESGNLIRAEEDTNKDGRVDKWETYANGGLATVSFDTTGSGTPNRVIDYRSERGSR